MFLEGGTSVPHPASTQISWPRNRCSPPNFTYIYMLIPGEQNETFRGVSTNLHFHGEKGVVSTAHACSAGTCSRVSVDMAHNESQQPNLEKPKHQENSAPNNLAFYELTTKPRCFVVVRILVSLSPASLKRAQIILHLLFMYVCHRGHLSHTICAQRPKQRRVPPQREQRATTKTSSSFEQASPALTAPRLTQASPLRFCLFVAFSLQTCVEQSHAYVGSSSRNTC